MEATAQAVVSAHRHLHRVKKYKYNEAGNKQGGLQVSAVTTKDVKDAMHNTGMRKAKSNYYKKGGRLYICKKRG